MNVIVYEPIEPVTTTPPVIGSAFNAVCRSAGLIVDDRYGVVDVVVPLVYPSENGPPEPSIVSVCTSLVEPLPFVVVTIWLVVAVETVSVPATAYVIV